MHRFKIGQTIFRVGEENRDRVIETVENIFLCAYLTSFVDRYRWKLQNAAAKRKPYNFESYHLTVQDEFSAFWSEWFSCTGREAKQSLGVGAIPVALFQHIAHVVFTNLV